jgi:putative endonuclease
VRAKDSLGRFGEDLAVAHLEASGFMVLERNWRCTEGEIDIVAVDGDCLVVCEVKTRRSRAAGSPVEAVDVSKLRRLRRLTGTWLRAQHRHFREVRIDVIAVRQPGSGPVVVEHLKGVF